MQRKLLMAAATALALCCAPPAMACLNQPNDPIHCINNGVPVTGFSGFFNDNLFAPPGLGPTDTGRPDQILEFGGEVGAPIIKDRLWIWGSANRNRIEQTAIFDRAPDRTQLINYAGKLSGQTADANEANAFVHFGDKQKQGRGTSWGSSSPAIMPVGPGPEVSVWNIEGVNITDAAGIGASPTYYDFGAIEEIQVATGGGEVSQLTGGIGINIVTKRGSNEFRGSARAFFTNDALQGYAQFVPTGGERPPGTLVPLTPDTLGALDFPLNALPAATRPGGINVFPPGGGPGFRFSFVDPAALNPAATAVGSPTQPFGDVPASNPFFRFIEDLQRRGTIGAPPARFADVPATSPFARWIDELARRNIVSEPGTAPIKPFGAAVGGRTFVLPHVLEVSGNITNVKNTFDTQFFMTYAGGLAEAAFPDQGAKVDIYLFDQNSGRPLINPANEQVCNPCTLPLGGASGPRKQAVRMDELMNRSGGFPGQVVLGFAIAVIGGDPGAVNMQSFVTNSSAGAMDLGVFTFAPSELRGTGAP